MRTKHWIVAVLFVGVVAYSQAYALTTDRAPEVAPQAAAEVEEPRTPAGPQQVVSQESTTQPEPADEPVTQDPAPVAPEEPGLPRLEELVDEVETLIVGFKQNPGEKLMEAIVRAAGATPEDTVSAPRTLVASVNKAESEAVIAQLEKHVLVDYVAVPKPSVPSVTASL